MNPLERIKFLNSTGAAVYLYGAPNSYPVARMGVLDDGRLWYQQGDAAHVAGPADKMREDGCQYIWQTPDGRDLAFVAPEDADDWELGDLITAMGNDRQSVTAADLLANL